MTNSSQEHRAFTIVELCVVTAVLASIAAFVVPAVMRTQEKPRTSTCLSSVRQLALALNEYAEDHDSVYPWSTRKGDRRTWLQLSAPYVTVARGKLLPSCPDVAAGVAGYSANGQVLSPIDDNHRIPSPGFYDSPVNEREIPRPAATVMIGDGVVVSRNGVLQSASPDFAYPHPSDDNDRTYDSDPSTPWFALMANDKQIAWRHAGGANFAFCDGHAEWLKCGSLRDLNWDVRCAYGHPCSGAPTSPTYLRPTRICGTQSPLDCN